MAIDNVNNLLYVPCATGAEIFNTSHNAKMGEINFTAQGAFDGQHAALSSNNTLALSSNAGFVFLFPPGQTSPSATRYFGTPGRYMVWSLDGTRLFVFLMGNYAFADPQGNVKFGNVAMLDSSLNVLDVVQAGYGTIEFAAMAGNRIYAPSSDGYLYSFDPVANVQLDSKFLGGILTGISFNPDGKLYICDKQSSVLRTITVGGTPTSDRIGKSIGIMPNFYPFGITSLSPVPKGKK